MTAPHPIDGDFPAYASAYRLAAARLLEASAAGPVHDEVVRSLLASWRNHVELGLEHLLQVGGVVLDQGWRPAPRAASLELLWGEAYQLLSVVAGRPEQELEAARRAVSQLARDPRASAPADAEALPAGWRIAEMHAAMSFLSELLEREVRRLRRLEVRRVEALTWMA